MKLISIIIPIYNAESTIKKCIDSIINQSYKNLEVILINDGSKDSCDNICKDYQENDKRIKYFYKNNGGVSSARNLGLKYATGDYITFVDADDYIDKMYIEKMLANIEKYNADFLISNYKINNCKAFEIDKSVEGIIDNRKFLELFYKTGIMDTCWGNLIKTEILEKNKIVFNEIYSLGEDALFTYECYAKSKISVFYDEILYNYVAIENSLSRSRDKEKKKRNIKNYISVLRDMQKIAIENKLPDRSKYRYLDFLIYEYLKSVRPKYKDFKDFYKEIKSDLQIIIHKTVFCEMKGIHQKIDYILLKFNMVMIYYYLNRK